MPAGARPLVLTVDAQIDPFKRALVAGKASLADFGKSAADTAHEVEAELRSISANPAGVVNSLSKSLTAQIAAARSQADAVLRSGATEPSGGFTAASSVKAADGLAKLAAAERTRAAAATAAIAGDQAEAAGLKLIATAATANVFALEEREAALRKQAGVLALVEAEETKLRDAAGEQANTVVAAHGRMSVSGQILQHSVRSAADSFAAGLPVTTIFTEQVSRLAEAAAYAGQEAEGSTGPFARFGALMSGPWGLAIIGGVTVLGALIGHLDLFGNEVDEAAKKLGEQAHETDVARQAQAAYDATLEGSIEKQRKFTDELDRRIKSQRQLDAEQLAEAQQSLTKSRQDLPQAQAAYDEAKDRAARTADALQHPSPFMDPGALTGLAMAARQAQADLVAATKTLNDAKAGVELGQRGVRDAEVVIAKGSLAGRADPDVGKRDAIQQRIDQAFADYAAGKISKAVADAITVAGQRQLNALQHANTRDPNRQSGRQVDLSGAIAIAKAAGLQVNSAVRTYDQQKRLFDAWVAAGKPSDNPVAHPGASAHERGGALDIQLGRGVTLDTIRKAYSDAGVTLSKVLLERGHAHIEFGPSAEASQRAATVAATRDRHDGEAKSSALADADRERTEALRQGLVDPRAIAAAQIDDIEQRLTEQLGAAAKDGADHHYDTGQVQAKLVEAARIREAAVEAKQAQDLADRDNDQKRAALQTQGQLLELQGQLAPTLKERLAIALQLVEIDRQEKQLANDRLLTDGQIGAAEHDANAAGIDQNAGLQRQVVAQQNAGPLDQYRRQLQDNVGDLDTSLEHVKVDALQGLEDGLLGLVNGTESVSGAFKKMAASIIADLARIAIEKAILGAIGLKFADGGAVTAKGHADGGLISGAGGPRDDKILARLSNGEFVVNAAATRRHGRLLHAINDDALPAFADGGLVGTVAFPALPTAASLRPAGASVQQHFFVNAQGAVLASDLMAQMQRIGTVTLAAAPGLTRQEMAESSAQAIPT